MTIQRISHVLQYLQNASPGKSIKRVNGMFCVDPIEEIAKLLVGCCYVVADETEQLSGNTGRDVLLAQNCNEYVGELQK